MKLDPRFERRVADVLARRGWRVQRTVDGRPNPVHLWDDDAAFAERYAAISKLTLVTAPAAFILEQIATQALHLDGEFVEVGVYQGGTARLLADVVNASGRRLHLFDTFTGMPATDPSRDLHEQGDFSDTSLASIERLLADASTVTMHPGVFPDTAAGLEEVDFAFVHVDVDIYQSVWDACDFFVPRLVPGGFLVVDDYGWTSCPGAKTAVDEYFVERPEVPIYLPTGQALITKLPPIVRRA